MNIHINVDHRRWKQVRRMEMDTQHKELIQDSERSGSGEEDCIN
jgi:hypothetical protein